MSKQNARKYLARLITELVNRKPGDPQCLPAGFIEKYGIPRYRFGSEDVDWAAQVFRQAWDDSQNEAFAQNLEQVFADRLSEIIDDVHKLEPTRGPGAQEVRAGSMDLDFWKYARPAFRVVPGKRGPVFFPRDLLDRMARELLRAFSSNRLRVCGRKDKGCFTPLFVASHGKQKYCYRGCGAQALSEWQADFQNKRRKRNSKSRKEK